jgi:hypothetical protein
LPLALLSLYFSDYEVCPKLLTQPGVCSNSDITYAVIVLFERTRIVFDNLYLVLL